MRGRRSRLNLPGAASAGLAKTKRKRPTLRPAGLQQPYRLGVLSSRTCPSSRKVTPGAALNADPAFGPSVVQTNRAGDLALVSVPVNGDPSGQAATARSTATCAR